MVYVILQNLLIYLISALITGKNYLVTKIGRCNKCSTKQLHTHKLHTQQLVACTWLVDHQVRPSSPRHRSSTSMSRDRRSRDVISNVSVSSRSLIKCGMFRSWFRLGLLPYDRKWFWRFINEVRFNSSLLSNYEDLHHNYVFTAWPKWMRLKPQSTQSQLDNENECPIFVKSGYKKINQTTDVVSVQWLALLQIYQALSCDCCDYFETRVYVVDL